MRRKSTTRQRRKANINRYKKHCEIHKMGQQRLEMLKSSWETTAIGYAKATTATTEAAGHERKYEIQGGKNWILSKEINANRFFWDSHWLKIWKKTLLSLCGTELEGAWLYGLRVNNGDAVSMMRLYGRPWNNPGHHSSKATSLSYEINLNSVSNWPTVTFAS